MNEGRQTFQAMGCPCEIRLYAESETQRRKWLELAVGQVRRLEKKYSRYRDDSVTARILGSAGSDAGIRVDDETAALLDYAATAWEQSDGLFDITSGVLRRAWDFRSGNLPSPEAVEALLPLIGWQKLHWERPCLQLPRGMELDFGGFVKEYAADAIAVILREQGCRHGLVDLGGDLAVVGPHSDGSAWQVGIRNPRAPDSAIAQVGLTQGAVTTSGDYERSLVVNGKVYGHILNPVTGWPVEGLASVSVLAGHCVVAGSASTIAMLKGEQGRQWLDDLGLPYLCVDSAGGVSGALQN